MQAASRPAAATATGPWRSRRARAGVLVLAAAAVASAAAALAVTTVGHAWSAIPAAQLLVDAGVGLGCPLVGALMVTAGRLGPGARLLALVLVGAGLASAAAALTTALAMTADAATVQARLWAQLQSFLWVPGFLPLLTLVPLLYPDGLLPGRTWRWAAAASVAGTVLLSAGVATYDEALTGRVVLPKLVTAPSVAPALTLAAGLLLVPAVLSALAAPVVRLRAADALGRRQVVVLLVAVAVLLGVTAAQGLVPAPVDVLAQAGAVVLLPLAIGVAVTRHRLYDLDLAVCRALVVASLAACLVGAYLSVFAVVQALGQDRHVLSAALAAGVTGAVIQPLGRHLAAGVDRLYFGHRAEPYVVTSHIAARLTGAGPDLAEVPDLVCSTVVADLRLRGARLWVDSETGPAVAAIAGQVDDALGAEAAPRFPLRHRGVTVGYLEASPREGEQRLHQRDLVVLRGVADQAAPAVAALQLRQALQRSRESLVAARESERRRLRRDLHDGLGAALAGVRLQVETAQELTKDRRAASLLATASAGVATAVAEVRTLCEGLRPAGLDDLGLDRALAVLAARMEGPGLAIEVDVDGRLDLDPAVEVALLRIAAEALANVARHSRAGRARLAVRAGASVDLEVRDDGVGLDAATGGATAGSGLGLPSMRQRAEEVGGRLRVESRPGRGTTVRAVLPRSVGGTT